jgi:hypothetical protein
MILHRDNQQRFPKPCRFIQGFESRGAGHPAAIRHHAQKFCTIEFMKEESCIVPPYRLDLWFLTKAMQFHIGKRSVPPKDIVCVTLVQHIRQQKPAALVVWQLKHVGP